jgi:hypothetical protein
MSIKKTILLCLSWAFVLGCGEKADKDIATDVDAQTLTVEALATYYGHSDDGGAYLTKQQHRYYTGSLKMQSSAKEPTGSYKMVYNGRNITFEGKGGEAFWSLPMARLLAVSFSVGSGYQTPLSLKYQKQPETVRIQGILYNVYELDEGGEVAKLYSRVADGIVDRVEIAGQFGRYSAFSYNPFYEAAADRAVVHNIDIYKGSVEFADTKLIYSVRYIGFE